MAATPRQLARPGAGPARLLIPTIPDLLFAFAFLLVLWLGPFITNRDGDLGWHMATGRLFLDHGIVPQTEPFSHTIRGQPMVAHAWLGSVTLALAYRLGEYSGVALLTALIFGVSFGGLAWVMRRHRIRPLIAGPLVALAVLAAVAHLATRPHMYTLLLSLVWVAVLEHHRRQPLIPARRPPLVFWALVPLMALWANLHGAFLVGLQVTATYLAGALIMALGGPAGQRAGHRRQARDLLILLVLSGLATLLNPAGAGLVLNNTGFFAQQFLLDRTPEYQSPDFHNPLFWPLLLIILITLATSVPRQVTPVLLLCFWAAASLYSFRNLMQFLVICLPFVAEAAQTLVVRVAGGLPAWSGVVTRRIAWLDAALADGDARAVGGVPSVVLALLAAVALLNGVRIDIGQEGYGFLDSRFPLAALERYGAHPPGERVLNERLWGGYLIHCCQPQIPVFFDARIDTYGVPFYQSYEAAMAAEPGWQAYLARYGVDWALLKPTTPLAAALAAEPGWTRVYADDVAVVFVKE